MQLVSLRHYLLSIIYPVDVLVAPSETSDLKGSGGICSRCSYFNDSWILVKLEKLSQCNDDESVRERSIIT